MYNNVRPEVLCNRNNRQRSVAPAAVAAAAAIKAPTTTTTKLFNCTSLIINMSMEFGSKHKVEEDDDDEGAKNMHKPE